MKKIIFIILILVFRPGNVLAVSYLDYYNAGMTYFQQNQFAKSIDYFKAAVKMEPKDWQSYEAMGRAYYSLQQYGDSYDACNKSLDINPGNASLQALVDRLVPLVVVPPPAPTKNSKVTKGGRVQGPTLTPHVWMKFTLKMDYSLEGDFTSAANGWNVFAQQSGATTQKASAGNLGVGGKIEVGHAMDDENALCYTLSAFALDSFVGDANNASATIHEKLSPLIVGLEVDYCHFWPTDTTRFYLKGGIGFYYAFVNLSQTISGQFMDYSPEIGVVGNGDFGLNIGAGYELKVDKDLAVELSGELRYATITSLVQSSSGPVLGLAVLPNGYLGVVDTKTLGGKYGGRLATIDLTGGELGLSLVRYFF